MMTRTIVTALALTLVACEPEPATIQTTYNVEMSRSDLDRPYGDLWLDIAAIRAHHTERGWQSVTGDLDPVNTDALIQDRVDWFTKADLPAGRYDQLRLELEDAWVEGEDGFDIPVDVPEPNTAGMNATTMYCLWAMEDASVDVRLSLDTAVDNEELWLRPAFDIVGAPRCPDELDEAFPG